MRRDGRKNRAKIRIFDYNPASFPEASLSLLPACVSRIPRVRLLAALLERLVSVPEVTLHVLVEFQAIPEAKPMQQTPGFDFRR